VTARRFERGALGWPVAGDSPFNKLVLWQPCLPLSRAGVSIEELAKDIARRTLLQEALSVRPRAECRWQRRTGIFEVPAGRPAFSPGARAFSSGRSALQL